ncbi:MAG: DUF368 domain-containing protein, partial [Desulfobacula sp.]|nr:DUF368 domain-containing protein [Desulfobacula sp.]
NKANIICLLSYIIKIVFKSDKITSFHGFVEFLKNRDFIFLLKLIAGAIIAILSLSSLMKYLIVHQFCATYSLFFGLILVSIIIPVKMVENKKACLILFAVIGAAATIYVSYAVNPYDKVKKKSQHYQAQYLKADHNIKKDEFKNEIFSFTGKYTYNEYAYALICGAIAISAMVLPGISGSLVLILMGEYFAIVSAISGLGTLNLDNMVFLGCFSMGIVFGGLVFAKLVNMLLKRFYSSTMAFLAGLMTGSLYALWPFKKSIIMAQQYIKQDGVINIVENARIYTNINELPQPGPQLYISGIFFITGCIIMLFFIKKELKSNK